MFTWILIAIIVAALFGVINLDNVRHWIVNQSKKAWPHVQKYASIAKDKAKELHSRVEKKDSDDEEIKEVKEVHDEQSSPK